MSLNKLQINASVDTDDIDRKCNSKIKEEIVERTDPPEVGTHMYRQYAI